MTPQTGTPPTPEAWLEVAQDHYYDAAMADVTLREMYATPGHPGDESRRRAAQIAALHQSIGFHLKAGALAAQLAIAGDLVITPGSIVYVPPGQDRAAGAAVRRAAAGRGASPRLRRAALEGDS